MEDYTHWTGDSKSRCVLSALVEYSGGMWPWGNSNVYSIGGRAREENIWRTQHHSNLGRGWDSSAVHTPAPPWYSELLNYQGHIVSTRSGMEFHWANLGSMGPPPHTEFICLATWLIGIQEALSDSVMLASPVLTMAIRVPTAHHALVKKGLYLNSSTLVFLGENCTWILNLLVLALSHS